MGVGPEWFERSTLEKWASSRQGSFLSYSHAHKHASSGESIHRFIWTPHILPYQSADIVIGKEYGDGTDEEEPSDSD